MRRDSTERASTHATPATRAEAPDGGTRRHGRRTFIVGAAAATVAATTSVGGYRLVVRDRRRAYDSSEVDDALLRPLAGDELTAVGPGGAVAGVLTSVSEPTTYRSDDGTAGSVFSVLVETREPLEQGTYEFRHAGLGTFPMFIVPVDLPEPGRHRFEAVFSRLD